jgi:undecaprenyl diphosphate synthase
MPGPEARIPAHVAIIMDGNGRWAKQRGLPRVEGHRRGAERAKETVRAASGLGVRVLTLYTFSLENWARPEQEVTLLMRLLERYLQSELDELAAEGVRFRAIGETWRLPEHIRALVARAEATTRDNTGITLVTALSYGGRNEIIRAARKALALGLAPEELTEERFAELLDTADIPPPDLIIRTSGEQRLSNFLPWQSAYAELYFTETHWPEFDREELKRALESYSARERRFGALTGSTGEVA